MAINSGFSHWKWWFSIAMLVYQRVISLGSCMSVHNVAVLDLRWIVACFLFPILSWFPTSPFQPHVSWSPAGLPLTWRQRWLLRKPRKQGLWGHAQFGIWQKDSNNTMHNFRGQPERAGATTYLHFLPGHIGFCCTLERTPKVSQWQTHPVP